MATTNNKISNESNQTFDKISDEFSSTIIQTKKYVRKPLLLKLVGNIEGKTVVDFGCGDGYFTRILAKKNPQTITGIDFSNQLIEKANTIEYVRSFFPPNCIKYLHEDIKNLAIKDSFNLISSVYFLNYAESKEDLLKIIQVAYDHLNEKGKFCSIVPHPKIQPMGCFEYGRKVTSVDNKSKFENEDILRCEIREGKKSFGFNFYYYTQETYTKLLQKVGFKDIQWVEPFVSEEGINKYGEEYWNNFLKKPSSIGFTCYK
jgi:toxoflavin synthase